VRRLDATLMKILKAVEIADVDRLTTEIYCIPSLLLMENAGRAVADAVESACPSLSKRRILILCGKGNNGGDGLVVARYLFLRGASPDVLLLGDPARMKGDARTNWDMVSALGIRTTIIENVSETAKYLRRREPPDVVVDALFGTGLSQPVSGGYAAAIRYVNRVSSKAYVAAVDIPSGLFADSAAVPGPCVEANLTVTFSALKAALVFAPAAQKAGRVVVAPIGSPRALIDTPEHRLETVDAEQVRRVLPRRPRDGHKGTFGHLFVLAGSRGKSGASLMSGMAALRSGAGLVTLLMPEGIQKDTIGRFPEVMTEPLPETKAGSLDISALPATLGFLEKADAVVVGPGLTTNQSTIRLVQEVVRQSPVPVVLDADGINAFISAADDLRNGAGQIIVVTPHPGEMARLRGTTIAAIQRDRLEAARAAAHETGTVVVLTGHQTLTALPEGRVFINTTGNPGMATGGTGDILSGMMGRFVASWNRRYRGADRSALADSVTAAVYLHGLAGDLAAQVKGEESLVATDLLATLHEAFREVMRE